MGILKVTLVPELVNTNAVGVPLKLIFVGVLPLGIPPIIINPLHYTLQEFLQLSFRCHYNSVYSNHAL